jgi:hypothetical protein
MIYIYGDSHANACFRNLQLDNINCYESSITMHRIGRDNVIIHFNHDDVLYKNNIIVVVYGEVDCRCHIHKQIIKGRNEDDIIHDLVTSYIRTIKNNVDNTSKVIIVGVIPPTKRHDFEILHGPITHHLPFMGTDEERVRYTNKVNTLLENLSTIHNFIYFNPYSYYTRSDGTLNYELSDLNVHIGENSFFLEKFTELYREIIG